MQADASRASRVYSSPPLGLAGIRRRVRSCRRGRLERTEGSGMSGDMRKRLVMMADGNRDSSIGRTRRFGCFLSPESLRISLGPRLPTIHSDIDHTSQPIPAFCSNRKTKRTGVSSNEEPRPPLLKAMDTFIVPWNETEAKLREPRCHPAVRLIDGPDTPNVPADLLCRPLQYEAWTLSVATS